MQTAYPAGKFEKSLMAAECNGQMFKLMGEHVYSSLYKIICEDDIVRVEAMLEECVRMPGRFRERCVHIAGEDGRLDTYVMNACLEEDGKYYVELQNLSHVERLLTESELERDLLGGLLTLSGNAYFTYYSSNDIFSLFWMDYEQKVLLYSRHIAEWEEEMVSKKLVEEQDINVFRAFCNAVRKNHGESVYSFHGRIISEGKVKEAYRVKFARRNRADGFVVEGIWMGINENTDNPLDDYITGNNMDSLTRLLSKSAITSYVEASLEKGEKPAIVMVDIDDFKTFNDTYGHPFGDQVIVEVANIIRRAIGRNGVAGRVGGDEFLIAMHDYHDELGLRNYLREIRTNATALFQDRLEMKRITCSIGAARCGIDADNFSDLYRIADKALYIAKQKGKNRYVIYKPELHGRFNTESDNADMKEIRESFYSEKALNDFHQQMADLVMYGREKLPKLLEQAAHLFEVNRILVFWGETRQIVGVYPPGLKEVDFGKQEELFEKSEYIKSFRNDMLQCSNINMYEFTMPEVYKIYQSNGTRSVLQHLLRGSSGERYGFVTAAECGSMRYFPQLAEQLFKTMCRVINAVLLRDEEK